MTMFNIAVFLSGLLGFAGLALAMPKHSKAVFQRPLPHAWRRLLRTGGWVFLALALALSIYCWHVDIGTVTWLGWLSLAGLVLVFVFPRWSLPNKTITGSLRDGPIREPGSDGRADTDTSSTWRRLPATRTVFAAAALLIPLVWFSGQLLSTPKKPLLRDDAIHGQVGPWRFTLAEKQQEPPDIVALDVPLKAFVIRFCENCEREIRMVYLKVRKPHSLRAAGNAFEGRGPEKTAEIPVPRAATVDDGLWLTVEATNGEVYYQQFDIDRLSPSLARFIQERP